MRLQIKWLIIFWDFGKTMFIYCVNAESRLNKSDVSGQHSVVNTYHGIQKMVTEKIYFTCIQ